MAASGSGGAGGDGNDATPPSTSMSVEATGSETNNGNNSNDTVPALVAPDDNPAVNTEGNSESNEEDLVNIQN